MSSSIHRLICGVILALLVAMPVVRADWQEPKDGTYNEKQIVNYFQVQKEAMDNWKAAGKAIEGSPSGAAVMAMSLNNDARFRASLASHGLSQEEFVWIGTKVWEAWGSVTMDRVLGDAQKALAEQRKTNEQKITDAKAKLAIYQKAQTEGRKVMSKEDREQVIASAKTDQQAAQDEARQHADEVKQAQADAAKADADAKAADALAKNPPADVSADDRPGFIDQKKTEAQQARDAAKDARDKEVEAKKLQDESTAKAAAAGKKITDPTTPLTDDEKAEVKKENDDQVTALTNDISEGEQGLKLLDESVQTYAKTIQEQKAKNPVPPQNVELLKKHITEFETVWGVKTDSK
jgi:colicin import membrane protein